MMNTTLSRAEILSLCAISAACLAIIANTFQGDGEPLIASLAFSGIAFASTYCLIRWLGPTFMAAGLKGKDMSKIRKIEMYISHPPVLQGVLLTLCSPETMGALSAVVYLLTIIIFIPFPFYKDIVAATSGGGNRDVVIPNQEVEMGRFLHRFPHSKVLLSFEAQTVQASG